jgi:hypothetical protein
MSRIICQRLKLFVGNWHELIRGPSRAEDSQPRCHARWVDKNPHYAKNESNASGGENLIFVREKELKIC